LIVHIAADSELSEWAGAIDERAVRLAKACWPGPLTLVVPRGVRVPPVVTGGLDTVGLRVPDHPLALALLRAFGGAVAAPSAKRFGRVSPTTAAHVRAEFPEGVGCILDGGPCEVGVESTIVDLSSDATAILRPGGITRERVSEILEYDVPVLTESSVRVPGQLASHYAPGAEVLLAHPAQLGEQVDALKASGRRVGVLLPRGAASVGGDVEVAAESDLALAHDLYAALRDFDARKCDVIVAAMPAEQGIGLAIIDRLRRAAGPRR
jgi:L-threonylcarbamoyladenylate synthase